jgi:hypothetical protein
MNKNEATEYLKIAVETETGKDCLRSLFKGADAIIAHPEHGDANSTIKVAEALRNELQRRYRF